MPPKPEAAGFFDWRIRPIRHVVADPASDDPEIPLNPPEGAARG